MLNQKVLDELATKVGELLAQSPVKDVEKNIKVMLAGVFTKLDLVTREEFEVQQEIVRRTREKLSILEARVTELESLGAAGGGGVPAETLDDPAETE
jgi:BMFP domain-containing protein YqiC